MKRKVLCLFMSILTVLSMSTVVNASEQEEIEIFPELEVYSEEYPEAYIVVDMPLDVSRRIKQGETVELGNVKATVFVEEDGNGSRLLSKEEVDEYGIENFQAIRYNPLTRGASNSKGTLTITLSGTYSYINNSKGVKCDVSAGAKWSGYNFITNNSLNPAVGEDFLGLTWGGEFNLTDSSASGKLTNGASVKVYAADGVPNCGQVYSFDERNYQGAYLKNLSATFNLRKNKMTGDGNRTEAVLKYIHTYQANVGSISISASSGSVSGGFSLSPCDKQWSIICRLTNIPY